MVVDRHMLLYRILRRIFLFLCFIIIVTQVSRLWNYFNTGADQSEILFRSLQQITKSPSVVDWAIRQPEGAALDEYSRRLIGERYGEAWQAWNNALALHRTEFLPDYFVDSLADRMAQIDYQVNTQRVVITHHLVPLQYSLDKQFILFEDHQEEVIREVYRADQLLLTDQNRAVYLVIMTLEEGRWMVRYLKKTDRPKSTRREGAKPNEKEGSSVQPAIIPTVPKIVKGINYYPMNSPWTGFWKNYNPDTIWQDLQLIKDLGFDAVRIFIPYYDSRDPLLEQELTVDLTDFLERATQLGLTVIPTLFDFPESYDLQQYPAFRHYLYQLLEIIEPYSNSVLIDLKNEADLDFNVYPKEKVVRWLEFIIEQSRKNFPSIPLTIGWSTPEMGHVLQEQVDVVSYHFYGPKDDYIQRATQLKTLLPPDKPLLMSEFGRSTFNPFWFPLGNSREEQREYIGSLLDQSSDLGIPTIVWCLYDYPNLPDDVFGWKPWIKGTQSQFGLIDQYGIRKPSASLFEE